MMMARARVMPPYAVFAAFYDQLVAVHRPMFEKARRRILARLFGRVRLACDLCAGTGTTALELARGGSMRVYAVDASPQMCGVARAKARRAKLPVQVIEADMRSFRLPEPVDLVTCEFDAINHVPRKQDLERVARAVARALRPGGHFLFDANTRRSFREVWPMNWVTEGRGFFLANRGGYDARRDKGWTVCEWFFPAGKSWRRLTERYEEVAWSKSEIRRVLGKAGLRLVRSWDQTQFARGRPWLKPGCRIFWLARKQ
jgi:SAM-dependent methyltransferase